MGLPQSVDSLTDTLSDIGSSSFSNADDRVKCLKAAEDLVRRLQDPWERVYKITCYQPILLAMMKSAADLDLFNHLSTSPSTSIELGEKTGSDPELMLRILRFLAVEGLVVQIDEDDKWIESDLSQMLKDPNGLVNGIGFAYDVILQSVARLPKHLQKTDYQDPSRATRPPMARWNSNGLDFWGAYEKNPEAHTRFNNWLYAVRVQQVPWPTYYPLSNILDGDLNETTPLAVDVGGGKGGELKMLVEALPKEHIHRRVILQDQSSVIKEAQARSDMPSSIEYIVHDFFKPQPPETQGSKVYYLRNVLHDWPDEDCRRILSQLRDAMIPDYSKILLREAVLPMRAEDTDPSNGALDIMMMGFFGAKERTEAQWRTLIESAGLRFVSFTPSPGTVSGIIQVEI